MSSTYNHGGNILTVARNLGIAPTDIIDFSASINPLGLSPKVKDAIIGAIDGLIHYPDSSHLELKQALADHHGVATDNIVLANGSTELIYNIPTHVPGRRALVVSPSFSEYLHSLKQHQWEITHFILSPADGFAIDMHALQHELNNGYDALFLCNPGNPNGTLYPLQAIEQIAALCHDSGVFLILDEAFMDFCEASSAKRLITDHNLIILRSMTKFYGFPGLRLGYAMTKRALADRLDAVGGPWSVNTLALTAGVAALRDSEHTLRTIAYVQQEYRRLFDLLARFEQLRPYPSVTNFILIEIIAGPTTAIELKGLLMQHRILIRDCSDFIGLSSRFVRVAVKNRAENDRLLECFAEIF